MEFIPVCLARQDGTLGKMDDPVGPGSGVGELGDGSP